MSEEQMVDAQKLDELSVASVSSDFDKLPQAGTDEFAELCKRLDRRPASYRILKRAFDLIFSLCVIVVGFIPCALLSIAIVIDSKGSPIYSQIRVGKRGKPFKIYKFRTMVAESDDVEKYLSAEQLVQWKRERKVDDDPRITRLGKILRKTSIDEFPQFLNVFTGEISVVGPRAITYDELAEFGSSAAELLSCEPGITGLWQSGRRNEANFENGERQKIELQYVQTANLSLDCRIIIRTFGAMFAHRTGK